MRYIPEITNGLNAFGLNLCLRQHGQKHGRQHANDGYNDKEFDQGKTKPTGTRLDGLRFHAGRHRRLEMLS